LSGGAGTRLWPLSRQSFPKQLLPVTGGQSLLQETALRVSGEGFAPAVVVGSEDQRFFIKRQLEAIGAPIEAILLEPVAKNTSAAAALAASWLSSAGADELMLLMPSDHVIGNRSAFLKALGAAVEQAENGAIVTFGATPDDANTQYGYIAAVGGRQSSGGVAPIARFIEKPDAATAAAYLEQGGFYWNAGIFLMKASTLLDEMREFLPDSLNAISSAVDDATRDGVFVRPGADAFSRAENVSIDHGIMEKTSRGMVVPVQMDWSDVGSWEAVWKLGEKEAAGNLLQGDVVTIDTRNSLLRSDGPLIATLGLDRMAVIAARDAILVAPLDRVADLKKLVEGIRSTHSERLVSPPKVARPWGSYESIAEGGRFQVKHIIVDPSQSLSLQMHYQRAEHWVVVRGSAEVTVGDTVSILQENESTFIPAGTKHRLANPGKVPLELIEIQCGPYLGEDDILRFDDEYGRQ
jgi:mannose-1-phosphate guanylyltransferase/mannose-6-phosphate isomerase